MTRYLLWAGSLLIILLFAYAFFSDGSGDGPHLFQDDPQQNKGDAQVSQAQLDAILAKDLALTSSLFIRQLSDPLKRWANSPESDAIIFQKLVKEVEQHPHIYGAALVTEGKIEYQTEGFHSEALNQLDFQSSRDEQAVYSNPYSRQDRLYMLIAWPRGKGKWLVGEADLDFIKRFVGDLASVADANGHFFVGGKEPEVQVKDKKQKTARNEEKVPELGWTVVVQSEGKPDQVKNHYRQGEVLVRFKDGIQFDQWLKNHPEFILVKKNGTFYVLRHPHQSTEQLIKSLQKDPQVSQVEPNTIFTKQEMEHKKLPNDEFFREYQWNLAQIGALEGWKISEGRDDLIIAILDTGIDPHHHDLKQKVIQGYNAIDDNNDTEDKHGHGTHVAGIAAAVTNNLTGIAGLSWKNKIMPVKVLNHEGEGGLYEVINGIYWATDHGAKVINLSLGDDQHSDLLYEAIRYAYEHDVVLVAASGNDNVSKPMYPAAYPEVLAVGAVNQRNEKASFSNYGDYLDVTAPGEHIAGTFIDGQYVFMSGTSMAAPHVTGLVALIRARFPELTNEEVMNLIRQTADDIGQPGYDPYYGYGVINVYNALNHVSQGKPIQSLRAPSAPQFRAEKKEPGPWAELKWWVNQLFDQKG